MKAVLLNKKVYKVICLMTAFSVACLPAAPLAQSQTPAGQTVDYTNQNVATTTTTATTTSTTEDNIPTGSLIDSPTLSAPTSEASLPPQLEARTDFSQKGNLTTENKTLLASISSEANTISVTDISRALNSQNRTPQERKGILDAAYKLYNDPNNPTAPGSDARKVQAAYNAVQAIYQYVNYGLPASGDFANVNNILNTVSAGSSPDWDKPEYKGIVALLAASGRGDLIEPADVANLRTVVNAFFPGALDDSDILDGDDNNGRVSLPEALTVLRDPNLSPVDRERLTFLAVQLLPPGDESDMLRLVVARSEGNTTLTTAQYLAAYSEALQQPSSTAKDRTLRVLFLISFYREYEFVNAGTRAAAAAFMEGDVNEDGVFQAAEFNAIKEVLAKASATPDSSWGPYNLDLNQDGLFNAADKGSFDQPLSAIPDPFPAPSHVMTDEDGSLMVSLPDSVRNGDPITYHVTGAPAGSQVSVDIDGTLTLILPPSAIGVFPISVIGTTDSGIYFKIDLNVTRAEPPATQLAEGLTEIDGEAGKPIRMRLPDGYSYRLVKAPKHGSLTFDPVTRIVVYTPDANFAGKDKFSFRLLDSKTAKSVDDLSAAINSSELNLAKNETETAALKAQVKTSEDQNKTFLKQIADLEAKAKPFINQIGDIDRQIALLTKAGQVGIWGRRIGGMGYNIYQAAINQLNQKKAVLQAGLAKIRKQEEAPKAAINSNNLKIKQANTAIAALKNQSVQIAKQKHEAEEKIEKLLKAAAKLKVKITIV